MNDNPDSKADQQKHRSRRSILKTTGLTLGASITGLGAVTGAASAVQNTNPEEDNRTDDGSITQDDGLDVEPEAITNATTQFKPYNISMDETSILQSRWDFQAIAPTPANYYQIDILVNSNHVSQPNTVSLNADESDITKDWEYTSSSAVGSAYHWQAKIWVNDILGASAQVDAEINPVSLGEVEAKTGSYWPTEGWSTGYLEIS